MHGVWQEFLKIVREEVGSRVVDTWFNAISLERWDAYERVVYLRVPNTFVRDWIQTHYASLVQVHLGRILNVELPRILFLNTHDESEPVTATPIALPQGAPVSASSSAVPAKHTAKPGYTHPGYLFNTFVVGPSNSLAYAAAQAVSQKPGELYNPLFIYGGSGLGKTHLLHAIGNTIKTEHPDSVVLYQTTDRFVTEFINAIRFDKVAKFQKKYQSVDVLLIDDVQSISHKEQTQEAFFHIFNTLYELHKQIVFSSDTFPGDINGITERLRSRLGWGMVTDIHQPSLETKVAILKKKAEFSCDVLSDEVAYFIATQVTSNIRELEGALVRVVAFASLTQQKITLELAKKVLFRTPLTTHTNQMVDSDRIIKVLTKQYPFSLAELRSKNKRKELVFARAVAMYLLRRLTDMSLRDIGSFLGGRDHSTVAHALEKMTEHVRTHPDFQQQLQRIEQDIFR